MPHPSKGSKNPEQAKLFNDVDPEKIFFDLREIGHGSFGAVFYARYVQSKEPVAIKKMSYSGKNSNEKWQDIVKEVEFFIGLKHEHCVKYHNCYLKDHTAWLVMEYCVGSASDILEVHKKPLQEVECAAICHGALCGLAFLHNHNRIHRDIKAGNILLSENGVVKLADFGSASMKAPANSFVGTPYWMSPEVILAMDEGQYDGKVDIWSLGITCIELAERKPPLFNMNAMSALYHIAQNDPPQLNMETANWSMEFKHFVAKCLAKQPDERPSADELLQEPFIMKKRPNNTILDLIDRTKNKVRALDKANYNRIAKIIMNEEVDGEPSPPPASQTASPTGRNGVAMKGNIEDMKSLSINSHSSSVSDDSYSESSSSGAQVQSKRTQEGPFIFTKPTTDEVEDRFATLRPAQFVARQMQEHKGSDAYREQLQVYKRLRQQHQKLILQLEQRQKQEMCDHRKALEREFENQMHTFDKEMEKLKSKHRQELEQKTKQGMGDEKKLIKVIKEQQDDEMRQVSSKVKIDYRKAKQQLKQDGQSHRASITSSQLKEKYTYHQKEEELKKSNEHVIKMAEELRKFRREQLIQRQSLEKHLLMEEMNTLQSQKDQAHRMLSRHHECTKDLEYKQLHSMHRLRRDQQSHLHETERDNQAEYNKKAEMELQKKHLLEIRQRPKTLKAQELKVKKQFHEACKIQERQYKILRKEMLAREPRERHAEINQRCKEDRMRKFADLGTQYEQSINDLLQKQKVRLDEIQVTELEALRHQLKQEEEVLNTYQMRQAAHLSSHIDRELDELRNRVTLRIELLEHRMVEESTRLQVIRMERLQDLQTRHKKELDDFEAVSRPEGSPHSSVRYSYTSGIESNRFNQGSPRHSNRSLGTPATRFSLQNQQPSRESSVSMTNLQASGYPEHYHYGMPGSNNGMNMQSSTRSRQSSMDSRNGNPGDRRSYHGPPSSSRR